MSRQSASSSSSSRHSWTSFEITDASQSSSSSFELLSASSDLRCTKSWSPGEASNRTLQKASDKESLGRKTLRKARSLTWEHKSSLKDTLLNESLGVTTSSQQKALNVVFSVPWLIIQVVACFLDIAVSMLQVFLTSSGTDVAIYQGICCLVLCLYSVDILLRMYGLTPRVFFAGSKWWNWIDALAVTVLCFATVLAFEQVKGNVFRWTKSPMIFRITFVASAMRLFVGTSRFYGKFPKFLRRQISQNKRRLVITEQDFDLDLTYITDRVIAMGVPASGCITSHYRNPISEVSRYFETYHKGHYKIINCCPEMPYKHSKFPNGHIAQFVIADHTPPALTQLLEFITITREWLQEDERNVVAVHCKAGKGRTGCLISAWLLYSGYNGFSTAQEALDHFAYKRTDLPSFTSGFRYQGVETPSQVRYVDYLEALLVGNPRTSREIKLPTPAPLLLRRLRATNLFPPDNGNRRLYAVVHAYVQAGEAPPLEDSEPNVAEQVLLEVGALSPANQGCEAWKAVKVAEEDMYGWDFGELEVSGDIRISIFDLALANRRTSGGERLAWQKSKAKQRKEPPMGKEPGCIAFFILNTAFLAEEELELGVRDLDLVSQNRSRFDPRGCLKLSFSRLAQCPFYC